VTFTERQSLVVVGFAHLVLFAILSLGLRSITPPPVAEDPTPVDVVNLADVPKIAKPPKPSKPAAPEKTVATAPEPTPKPEPAPAPNPTPIPKPEKPKPKVEPAEKPEPPKPEKVKPEKPKPEKAKPAPKLLDAQALSTLLDKSLPKAKVKPLDTSALAKSIEKALPKSTRADPRATATLIAAIRAQVAPCWNPPIGGADAKKMTVLLHLDINRDGSIVGRPGVVSQTGVTGGNADYARAFAETARRAVLRCAPLKLPPELYDQWKAVEINFDPSEMS
jgi:outer membrane biosynthesis protein TonB